MKLLHIIAAPRGDRSRTLQVANEFLSALKKKYALMSGQTLPHESAQIWEEIVGFSKGFASYDYYLISNPMWNFSIPYMLKHYIDVIMQAGILFNFTETLP